MLSLDELAEVEYSVQEAMWAAYEQTPDELKELGWIKPPEGARLTVEQFKARMINQAHAAMHFRIPGASYKSFKRRT